MPAQVLPSVINFADFSRKMTGAGFRKISADEFRIHFQRYGLVAPRPRPGRETGFIFYANGLSVCVWTTWLEKEKAAREFDSGWVLIIQEGNLVYAVKLNRTKNFLLRLYRFAIIARKRVINRPVCPECVSFMDIAFGRSIKSRYWACSFPGHKNSKSVCVSFDHALTPEMKEFLKRERKTRAYWRQKIREEGKSPHRAMLKRKPWKRTHPPLEYFK